MENAHLNVCGLMLMKVVNVASLRDCVHVCVKKVLIGWFKRIDLEY